MSQNNLIYVLATGVELEMVQILGGEFLRGSKQGNSDEIPQHEVTISPFALGKYPVTQAQYQAIMGHNPSNFQGDDLPVECVSWDDAVEFCNKLSQATGLEFRLPSEAEWEYTCRAGSETSYCFGENSNQLKEYAWYRDNSNSQTQSVGQKKPNAWGLYDMHGNVWEWCGDDWHDNYQGAPRDGSIWLNTSPGFEIQGTADKKYKVMRGGSWFNSSSCCRSAYRSKFVSIYRDYDLGGFRVALGF